MPAPKANPRHRIPRNGPLSLPAGGRKGRTPAWPIGKATTLERAVWAELWHSPQAVAWEALGWTRVVARYARVVVEAETSLKPAVLSEARQLEDRLGLTPKAMRMLLWTIEPDVPENERAGKVMVADRWREAAAS